MSNREISKTFVKGIRVLRAFDDADTHLTLADLAVKTGLDRASVRRLVLTLVELGYVRKSGRSFVLTPRVLALAGSFFQGNAFGIEVQPLLNRFSERLEGPVSLSIREEDAAVFVGQSAPRNQPVTFGFTVGSRLPLSHTAIGRMILAYDDPAQTVTYLSETPLQQYTASSLTDRDAIAASVTTCRTHGFAIVDNEFEAGVTAFAVPVGPIGGLKAVVGTSFPNSGSPDPTRIIPILQELARELAHTRLFRDT
ncbi:MAG: IclR family transcriptional regulator C-terminal domain-containing protein [Paracoccaceae bacterium]